MLKYAFDIVIESELSYLAHIPLVISLICGYTIVVRHQSHTM